MNKKKRYYGYNNPTPENISIIEIEKDITVDDYLKIKEKKIYSCKF